MIGLVLFVFCWLFLPLLLAGRAKRRIYPRTWWFRCNHRLGFILGLIVATAWFAY